MKINKISRIIISSTTVFTLCMLTACKDSNLSLKNYSNEISREEFEAQYEKFTETLTLSGHSVDMYEYSNNTVNSDGNVTHYVNAKKEVEKYDYENQIFYSFIKNEYENLDGDYKKEEKEIGIQKTDKHDTIINLKDKTYYIYEDASFFDGYKFFVKKEISTADYIPYDFKSLFYEELKDNYVLKYYKDVNVYTFEMKYDFSKELDKEEMKDIQVAKTFSTDNLIFQFYNVESTYSFGYKRVTSEEYTYSNTIKTFQKYSNSETIKCFTFINENQVLDKVDLTKYTVDLKIIKASYWW